MNYLQYFEEGGKGLQKDGQISVQNKLNGENHKIQIGISEIDYLKWIYDKIKEWKYEFDKKDNASNTQIPSNGVIREARTSNGVIGLGRYSISQ